MTEYLCKCGRKLQRSASGATTGLKLDGYAPGHECFGCPYVVPIKAWIDGGMQLDHYECIASKELHYDTYACTSFFEADSRVGHILSLDWDFLQQVAAECDRHPNTIAINREKDGGLVAYKSKYREDGRFDFCIYPTQNKAGAKAKRAIFEKFFTASGRRKDLTPEQEKEKILNDIAKGRALKEEPTCPEPVDTSLPTASVPACPAASGTAEPALPAPSPAPLAAASTTDTAGRPSFDYSGLSQKTIDTMHLAEREILESRQTYIVRVSNAVAMVHDELVGNSDNCAEGVVAICDNSKHGHRGGETFRAWCRYVGISKDAAYRFLQVDRLLSGASPEELATLEAASPSLLYAAAKPSAPAELVQAVKDGDITTHKQYQELLAERDEAKRAAAAARQREEEARAAAHRYHLQAEDAEAQRNAYADQQTEYIAQINELTDRAVEAERRASELEARPIEVAVQQPGEDDLARYRAEGAEAARREYTAQIASADAARKKADDKLKKLQETLQGRTDHLNAVAAELAKVKQQLKAQAAMQTVQAIPCSQCIYESDCCGITFLEDLDGDEDEINNRLTGCTAGKRKETPV